jgi:hypothetical protein
MKKEMNKHVNNTIFVQSRHWLIALFIATSLFFTYVYADRLYNQAASINLSTLPVAGPATGPGGGGGG